MNFEKALEAMKQGKTVKRNSNEKVEYFIRNDTGEITAFFYDRLNPFSRIALYSCELLADDWEICRESNKEENELSSSVKLLSDFAKSLQFDLGNTAMRTINSYQISDIVSALKTVLDYAKSTIKLAYLKNQEDKEPEMTAEKASKILDLIPDYINVGEFEYITHCSFSEIAESVRMAIEALENQNQPKPEKKCECKCKENSEKWIEKAVDNQRIEEEFKDALACIREQPRKNKPEKKRNCNCKNTNKPCKEYGVFTENEIIKELSISEDISGKKEISIKFNLEPLIDIWNMNLTKWISV